MLLSFAIKFNVCYREGNGEKEASSGVGERRDPLEAHRIENKRERSPYLIVVSHVCEECGRKGRVVTIQVASWQAHFALRGAIMFTLAGNLIRYLKKKNEKNLTILLLGLDNAGKTTLLFGLKDQMPDEVTPTIGFRPSTVVKGKYTIQWFDVGGSKNFRKVWQSYYSEVCRRS